MTEDLVTRLRHLVWDWRTRVAPQGPDWVSRIPPCCVEELAGCANELEEELDARLPALEPTPMTEWQPIATAPKDSSRILIYAVSSATGHGSIHLAWWAIPYENAPDERGWWETGLYGTHHPVVPEFVTHWMPLPDPPLPALEPPPVDKPHVDICRTPFEAFGHNESCGRWVEGPECILLDREQACTCGGVELDPDGGALDGPRSCRLCGGGEADHDNRSVDHVYDPATRSV